MANKELMNEDYAFTITPGGGLNPASFTVMTFIKDINTKSKTNNKGSMVATLTWTVPSGVCVGGGLYHNENGHGSMNSPTSSKEQIGGKVPFRKGDTGTCNCVIYLGYFPIGNQSCTFEVTNAGQIKSKGN